MGVIDELLVGLGYEYDSSGVKDFKQDIADTVDVVKKLTAVVATVTTAIVAMTIASTSASDEQGKLANEIGVSVGAVDALQFATQRAGGTIGGMTTSLRQLNIRAGETARGMGRGMEAFEFLDIAVQDANGDLKTTDSLLLEVSEQMQGLSTVQQADLANKLGLRDSLRLLQEGPEAIRELITEAEALGVTTDEDAMLSAEFQDSLTNLWQIIKGISRTLSRTFAPILTSIVGTFTDWWKANREIIEQNLPRYMENIGRVLKFLLIGFAAFIAFKIGAIIFGIAKSLKAATIAASAFKAVVFLIPLLIGALVAGLVLLMEDAITFFEGGESIFQDLIDKFPEWAKEIEFVAAVLNSIHKILEGIVNVAIEAFGLLGKIAGMKLNRLSGFASKVNAFFSSSNEGAQGSLDGISPGGNNTQQSINQTFNISGKKEDAYAIVDAINRHDVYQQASQELQTAVDQ